MYTLTRQEKSIIATINAKTNKYNKDNITRTNSYLRYFQLYPEIKWSFLASNVSRNAGWNMCDLESKWYQKVLDPKQRKYLFLTYEKANWLIFQDAYPQLLLYHYSTEYMRPMFHLLRFFYVSSFMEREWHRFWETNDGERLLTCLIINEQNVIQNPVISHPVYKKYVFSSLRYYMQQFFRFNVVLFPTCSGELYGSSVNKFTKVTKRIELGKRLANILFQPTLFDYFYDFAIQTPHTGSRYDYEQYVIPGKQRDTPFLRMIYPVVHHEINKQPFWKVNSFKIKKWLTRPICHQESIHLTAWYKLKQKQQKVLLAVADWLVP